MADDPAIEIAELRKTYRDGLIRPRRVEALKGVSLKVERGRIFGLLGPNGAGKTTLIKVLLGIVRKSGGEARMLGRQAGDRIGRQQVGYLPENHRIPRHHTGISALEYYGGLSGLSRSEVAARRGKLLESVDLGKWGSTSVRKYSKGMLQRLGMAQAMLHDPDLLVLDEPTDGVDPVGRSDMRRLLQTLKEQGKTIFINSHLLQEVELVCDHVAILSHGTLQRQATIEELTAHAVGEVRFELAGDEHSARQALDGFHIAEGKLNSAGHLEILLQVDSQELVDRAVDALRSAGVSIRAMVARRKTLEEAFLDIVRNAQGNP